MAANSTLLAIQCAAGIAAPPRCLQHGKILITNTRKTTILAANPALQYEAGVSVFTPCPLHGNAVSTKRNKTIVAAYPTKIEIVSGGIPLETVGKINNRSGVAISLDDEDIWKGSRTVIFPENIEAQHVGEFTHSAESRGEIVGSIVGLEYRLDDGKQDHAIKWIIAWSNPFFELNKVYTEISDTTVKWEDIYTNLEKEGKPEYRASKFGYSAELKIDAKSGTPTLEAMIVHLLQDEEKKA